MHHTALHIFHVHWVIPPPPPSYRNVLSCSSVPYHMPRRCQQAGKSQLVETCSCRARRLQRDGEFRVVEHSPTSEAEGVHASSEALECKQRATAHPQHAAAEPLLSGLGAAQQQRSTQVQHRLSEQYNKLETACCIKEGDRQDRVLNGTISNRRRGAHLTRQHGQRGRWRGETGRG